MEAEYVAIWEAAKEVVWLKEFFTDLEVVPDMSKPITLYCASVDIIYDLKIHLSTTFKKDLGDLCHFLGRELARFSQDTSLLACKPSNCPMDPNLHLSLGDSPLLKGPIAYRCLIDKLLYLTISKPDIVFVKGFFFAFVLIFNFKACSNSDWASYMDSCKSTTGFCVFMSDSLVFWMAKKQMTVFRSSIEAEYKVHGATTCEIIRIS
ncbi:uncharacterized mitochondrial protein AtMg00810-like [Benincasa hispida]|uniref:uncharacterized mitochondrial protein AtMg00810-like n=1 Tax=Benincasa hispida TaxID=102211 RepID=UPI001900BDAE|nr:uncharacterized mitochondrial protein AtMg00810-like [Benincasa hispida]